MKTSFLIALAFFSVTTFAKDKYVKGYTKKDGTYVEGHYRTQANDTKWDNYSTKGNTNPYTGKAGTKKVDDYDTSTETSSQDD